MAKIDGVDDYCAGMQAQMDGVDEWSNPYPPGDPEHMAWWAGHRRGQAVTHPATRSRPVELIGRARAEYLRIHA